MRVHITIKLVVGKIRNFENSLHNVGAYRRRGCKELRCRVAVYSTVLCLTSAAYKAAFTSGQSWGDNMSRYGVARGGMQTSNASDLNCPCGKPTSKRLEYSDRIICIHFTRKSTYWHVTDIETGKTKRSFKMPSGWQV